MKLINIGNGSAVSDMKILVVAPPNSAPVKRMVDTARQKGKLLDATGGKTTRSIIMLDNGTIVQSVTSVETMVKRACQSEGLQGLNEE